MPEHRAKPLLSTGTQKIFTDAERLFPSNFTAQARHIVAAHRPASLPKDFQPMAMGFSDWQKGYEQDKRQRRAAEEQARRIQQQAERQQQTQIQEEALKQRRLEEKKKKEAVEERKAARRLKQGLNEKGINRIADAIKRDWKAESKQISSTPINEPHVREKGSGTYSDNSRVGIELSYPYQTSEYQLVQGQDDSYWADVPVEKRESLTFGLKNEQGTKAYFIGDETFLTTDPHAEEKFHRRLRDLAYKSSPSQVKPSGNKRLREKNEGISRRSFVKGLVGLGVAAGVIYGAAKLYDLYNQIDSPSPNKTTLYELDNSDNWKGWEWIEQPGWEIGGAAPIRVPATDYAIETNIKQGEYSDIFIRGDINDGDGFHTIWRGNYLSITGSELNAGGGVGLYDADEHTMVEKDINTPFNSYNTYRIEVKDNKVRVFQNGNYLFEGGIGSVSQGNQLGFLTAARSDVTSFSVYAI